MFFFISKILAFLITPMFWIMGLLLWAILTKSQTRKKWLMIISFCLGWLLSNSFILNEVLLKWEGPVAKNSEITESYDIGIVLGGFSSFDTISNRYQLQESGDRLWQALYLYKTGKIKKILISGGSGSILHKKITEADKARDVLIEMGIPSKDLLIETNSRNTRENATESAKLINAVNPDAHCLLITSAFHMKRSMGCYKKVHLDITPYKADYMSKVRVWDPDVLLLPKPESLFGWNKLIREIVGYYSYKIAGYI
jgi:uncharacterized SAM-binding protein YcdF (DUF218 family)